MKQLWSDVKYGVRMMTKAKAFTFLAVATLAIGIGANTAIFSVVYGVLLRPFPFPDPGRLVYVWHTPPQKSFPGVKIFAVSAANYLDWKAQNHVFEALSVRRYAQANVTGSGEPKSVRGQLVSPDYFQMLGATPLLGRTLAADEDQVGRDQVVVLSYRFWQSQFGSDPGIVGRTIKLDDKPHVVVGVMPRNFYYPAYAEYWAPLTWTPITRAVRGEHSLTVMGRLKRGTDVRTAQAEMDTISRRLEKEYPVDDKGWGARVVPFREQVVGDVRPALIMLAGAVGFVLLIACANVANLMLAKVLDRRTEIAVRTALGASRNRILQQMLVEAVLVAVAGGVLGLFLAQFGVDAIVVHLSDQLPRAADIGIDSWVLAFTAVVSIAAGLIAGVAPAWRLSNVNVNETLKQSGRSGETGGSRMRAGLVVIEVALSLMLLVGAGLMLRTLWKLQSVEAGFDPHGLLTATVSLPQERFNTPQKAETLYAQVQGQLRTVPGVQSAALVDDLPLGGGSMQPVQLEGHPQAAMADQPEVAVRVASPDYFRTMRIRLLRGREFADSDTADRPRVAIISQSLARRFWPHEDALGKHVGLTFFEGPPREIVGIVDDVKVNGLDFPEDVPTFYTPRSQLAAPAPQYGEFRPAGTTLVVRTSLNPASLSKAVGDAVHRVDATLPVTDVATMEDLMADSLAPQRFNLFLLGIFAAVALLLAAVGIYSVVAYSVERRTGEIGIRMAMGAKEPAVLRMVLGDGMRLVLAGIGCGVVSALVLSRFLRSLVFGIPTTDIPTFVAVAALLSLVALAACFVPARRAVAIDPMDALREQ